MHQMLLLCSSSGRRDGRKIQHAQRITGVLPEKPKGQGDKIWVGERVQTMCSIRMDMKGKAGIASAGLSWFRILSRG